MSSELEIFQKNMKASDFFEYTYSFKRFSQECSAGEERPLCMRKVAGYANGEKPIPDFPVGANVKDFGAVGNGAKDDLWAIMAAIKNCPDGKAIYFPPGKYMISDYINLYNLRKRIVLRGDPKGGTSIVTKRCLTDIHLKENSKIRWKDADGYWRSIYSYGGGFVQIISFSESGIEDIQFEFPDLKYRTHFDEAGCNGIHLKHCNNCWIRNVAFRNADSGIFLTHTENTTIDGVRFSSFKGRADSRGIFGHHAIALLAYTKNVLVRNAEFPQLWLHEFAVSHAVSKNVFCDSNGEALHFDHHRYRPEDSPNNLWTNITTKDSSQIFRNNLKGSTNGEVYWNIHADVPTAYPLNTGKPPYSNNLFVGFDGIGDPIPNRNNKADLEGQQVWPINIYDAQLRRRLERMKTSKN